MAKWILLASLLIGIAALALHAGTPDAPPSVALDGSTQVENFVEHWLLPVEKSGVVMKPSALSIADINADGIDDLIVSNGGDVDEEPIAIYWGQAPGAVPGHAFAPFDKTAVWFGPSAHYHGACFADVNHDGCVDMVASVGGIGATSSHRLFLNEKAGGSCNGFSASTDLALPPTVPVSRENFYGIACDFGDIDGDGDFDLVTSSSIALQGFAADGEKNPGPYTRGILAIYKNDGTALSPVPYWYNNEPTNLHSMDVMFADVNLDGQLDVLSSSQGIRVYLGHDGAFHTVSDWDWPADPGSFSKGIDAAWIDDPTKTLAIAVALNNKVGYPNLPDGYHRIVQFCPDGSLCMQWHSPDNGKGDDVKLVSLDGDSKLDLLAVRWQTGLESDHEKAVVFWDPLDGGTSTISLSGLAHEPILAQDALAWAFTADAKQNVSTETTVQPGQNVVTFSGEAANGMPLAVLSVTASGAPVDYLYLPGDRWFTIKNTFGLPTKVIITFVRARTPDVVIADNVPAEVHFFRNANN